MRKKNSSKNGKTLKRVLGCIKNSRTLIIVSLIFSVVSVVLSLYIPILAGRSIDNISATGEINLSAIKNLLLQILACAVVTGVLQWLIGVINNRITYNTVKNIRNQAFRHIQRLPLSYLDSHSYGETVSRIITDAEQFADGLLLGFSQLFTGVITIAVTLIFMLLINPYIAAVVVILTPISLFAAKIIAKRTYDMFLVQSQTRGEQTAFINEMIQNQKTVQAFSYHTKSVEKFDVINEKLQKCSLKAIFFSSITNPTTRFINNLIYAAVGLTGAFSAINGFMTVGGFVSFLAYANQYTKPFNEISGVITELQNALACAARIFELIDEPEEIPDSGFDLLKKPEGNVLMDNVSFSYTKERSLIKNLNLSVSRGQKVAIVGPTGCGKTTLINLLMRFYDTNSGSINIDGKNIKEITRKSLRESFGMVLQDTWIKDGTVRENIAFGNPDATDEEVMAAAKATHAHGFIKRLEKGYDTVIGDESGNLSQGEKQLLSIARVMLMRPSMLILDEATSSIDTRTELKISDAFSRLMEGRTSFIVAHRLSTIQNSDIILVMKNGNIIEQGSHEELLMKNGFYAELYYSQFAS